MMSDDDEFEAAQEPGFVSVQCPSCFEVFDVAAPAPDECPTEWDYDCEICCRPMIIAFSVCDDAVRGDARSIED